METLYLLLSLRMTARFVQEVFSACAHQHTSALHKNKNSYAKLQAFSLGEKGASVSHHAVVLQKYSHLFYFNMSCYTHKLQNYNAF